MANVYEMADGYEYDPEKDPDYDPEYDEKFQKLAQLHYLAQLDDGSRRVIFFDLVKDPPQQKMQADNPEGETSLKKSEQIEGNESPPPFNEEVLIEEVIGLIERTMMAEGNSEADYFNTLREVHRLMREMRIGKLTRYTPDSADASEQMTQLAASNDDDDDDDDDDDEETSLKKSKQIEGNEEVLIEGAIRRTIIAEGNSEADYRNTLTEVHRLLRQMMTGKLTRYMPDSADAVNNVSEQMTQLAASNDDDEETSLKKSKQMQAHEKQERKRKLTRYMPDPADAVNNVSEQMTQLAASNDDDDEETSLKKSKQVGR